MPCFATIPSREERMPSPRQRISQRGILPQAIKFRLQEFYDASDNVFKFRDNSNNSIFTIDPNTGTITFFGNGIFQGALTYKKIAEAGYTSDLCTGGTPSASAENLPNEGVSQLFAQDYFQSKWVALSPGFPVWVQYQFASAKTIKKYTLTSGDDIQDRDPKDWQFQGSNNGSDFTTLDTRANQYLGARGQKTAYYFDNSTAYTYYRLSITDNWDSVDCQLMELEMMEVA